MELAAAIPASNRSEYVRELNDRHVAGAQDHGRSLWSLLMLELW